jgi:hypothetical protein
MKKEALSVAVLDLERPAYRICVRVMCNTTDMRQYRPAVAAFTFSFALGLLVK